MMLLLLFKLLLGKGLLEELPNSFLFDTDGFVSSWWLDCCFIGHGVRIRYEFPSISIDVILLCLWAEFLLALRLWLFQIGWLSLAVVGDKNAILVLYDGDAIRLSTLLRVLNYLNRSCRGLLVCINSSWLTQTLLVEKALISCELAED